MTLAIDRPKHVIILGAGPGGLACAHKLAELGYRVTVLEKEDYVGGLCKTTVTEDGYRFDIGGHRWFTKNQDLHEWMLRLMEGHLVKVRRISRILFDRKYFDYPISIGNVLKTAGIWTCFLCFLDYVRNLAVNMVAPRPIRSMEDAFVSQFGRRLYDMFFRRYSEKVWGRPCSEMSADWVSQRTKGLSIWSTIANALLKPKKKMATLIEIFVYPRYGYQIICERMREDVEAHTDQDNKVHLECLVRQVDVSDPDKVVIRYVQGGEEKTMEGDYVVSTVPLTALLAHGLHPRPPQDVIDAAQSLVFRSVITVNLKIDRPQLTADTWLYCHDEGLGFARLHEPRNWSPDMAPAGKTSVVLEYFCTVGDETWRKTDEELIQWGLKDLVDLGLMKEEEFLGGFCIRAGDAYPVYDQGYFDKLTKMRAYIEGLDRVAIVGRGGTFRYNNADHSVEMGLITAQMINGEVDKHAVLAVNSSLEYCESDLVSDHVATDQEQEPEEIVSGLRKT